MDAMEANKYEAQEDLGTELVLPACWCIIQSNEKAETTEMLLTKGTALKNYKMTLKCYVGLKIVV